MAIRSSSLLVLFGGVMVAVVGALLKIQTGCNYDISPVTSASTCVQSAVINQYGQFTSIVPGNLSYDFLGMALVILGIGLLFIGSVFAMLEGDSASASEDRTTRERELVSLSRSPGCPVCGQPLEWIASRNRWYCLGCKEYR